MSQPSFFRTLFGNAETRGRLFLIYVGLAAFNAVAWAWAFAEFSHQPVLIGTAFLAYVFGLRHAFDADHIAAIDNVVRKLMQEGQKPLTVGFYFSLGHSSIVIIASDGWDSDPAERLAAEMARLRRRAHRLLWLNPRASAPGFQPTVSAMAAALPYCDRLLPADTFRSLREVVQEIARCDQVRPAV